MAVLRVLDEEKLRTLYEWLHCMDMPVNRHLHREYSDCLLVAKLLKKLYPRYVDLHNYQPRLNHDSKMSNWQTLNYKVLHRIGLPLTNEQTDILARGTYGYVERLLWAIMNVKGIKPMRQSKYSKRLAQNQGSATSLGKRTEKMGDLAKKFPNDKYQQSIKEIRDKVLALENMLKERDSDIKTLVERVNYYEKDSQELKKVLSVGKHKKTLKKKPSNQRVRFAQSTKHEV